MRSPLALLVALALIAGTPVLAATGTTANVAEVPTYHKDIEPILQHNCQGCHRPEGSELGGMIAPMSLMTFEEVRPWARSIAREVEARDMPPWFASQATHGVFANERVLTAEQVATVVGWAKAGAPKGDIADAPAPREFVSYDGWSFEPDLVIGLAEPFWIDDNVVDLNISLKTELLTPELLPEPRWVAQLEFRPGSTAVHHIIGSKVAAEAETPGASGMIGGIAPGTEPVALAAGTGRLLLPGTQIYFQMHYNKEPGAGSGLWDNSQMAIKFHPREMKINRIVEWEAIGNRDFEIPPGVDEWEVGASKVFEHDTTLYSLLPHMHLRGKYASYTAFYPDGTQEVLLEVPEYDWNWQTNYQYIDPKFLPAGTRIEVIMTFTNNEERNAVTALELDTTRPVRFGGPTTDEMMLGFLDYAYHTNEQAETPSSGGQ